MLFLCSAELFLTRLTPQIHQQRDPDHPRGRVAHRQHLSVREPGAHDGGGHLCAGREDTGQLT